MIYPPYCLRISDETRQILDICKSEYGADGGLNRFIEAIGQYCLTGIDVINGIQINQFFEDAVNHRLATTGTAKAKLKEIETREYTVYSEFLKSDIGSSLLFLMCEKHTAAEFFIEAPQWIAILQEQFLDYPNGFPLRSSDIKKYTAKWYQERLVDGSAADYLKSNIQKRKNKRYANG